MFESEKETRWKRVDPLLKAAGWTLVNFKEGLDFTKLTHHAIREFPTSNGPADYALVVDGQILGIVEAKKVTLGPQNVLTQAERYSKGTVGSPEVSGRFPLRPLLERDRLLDLLFREVKVF